MKANQAIHSVRTMRGVLKISKSGFYDWSSRPMSARQAADIGLTATIPWYNPHRRHSALGYLSPINFERKLITQQHTARS